MYEHHKTFILDLDSGTCNCRFYEAMWLPCNHIISVFRHIGVTGGNFIFISSIFLVPLHDRWSASYNKPSVDLDVVPMPEPRDNDTLTDLLRDIAAMLQRIRDTDEPTCHSLAARIGAQCRSTLSQLKVVKPASRASFRSPVSKQPCWSSNHHTQRPCGICGSPVGPHEQSCPIDRLFFHTSCLPDERCPFCDADLQPTPGSIVIMIIYFRRFGTVDSSGCYHESSTSG